MKRLIILRHAKAENTASSGRDIDRPLSARGRHDAEQAGHFLAAHGLAPDLAIVSPAVRTRETWHLAHAALASVTVTEIESTLYNAEPEGLLAAMRRAESGVTTQVMVGHNPGLHILAIELVDAGNATLRDRLGREMPPGALAVIEFNTNDWANIGPASGRLVRYCTPADMQAEDSR